MSTDTKVIAQRHEAALQAMRLGQLREVHEHCLEILKLDPSFADAWFMCGVIAAHNGLLAKSVEILERAVSLAPDNPEYRTELGKQLLANQQPEQALDEAQAALTLKPSNLPTLNTLGTVFSYTGDHETALECFQRATRSLETRSGKVQGLSDVWRSELYFNFAAEQQFAGRFDEAEAAYEKAIELEPNSFRAHSALSTLHRQTPDKNHLARLQELRDKVSTPRDQLQIGFAIAKEQEDLGRYEDAFASLAWAKQAQAAAQPYDADKDKKLFATIKQLFNRESIRGVEAGGGGPEPIFVVGMPRTGTTLVQQILSGHSLVFAAGELQSFPQQVKRLTGSTAADLFDLAAIKKAPQLDMARLGSAYIQSTRPRTGHTPHFVDKLPLNFLYLGLIHLALPDAKIICLRRDPMDACLSNYRQLFAASFTHYQYNLDLLDCGRYYIEFDRIMRHWHEVMPGKIFEVQYEALVAEPEPVVRELLGYCDLPWEEECLALKERKASVATPSSVQVRQGIYTSSVNRWQRYGEAMQPLYELLRSAGFYP